MLKLNNNGSSHLLAVLALVVVLGAVGTFTLVRSHAMTDAGGGSQLSYYAAKCPKPHKNVYPGQANDANCVYLLQAALNTKSAGAYGLGLDGKYGSATYNAAKSYQARHGLKSDGYVGPATWQSINAVVGL